MTRREYVLRMDGGEAVPYPAWRAGILFALRKDGKLLAMRWTRFFAAKKALKLDLAYEIFGEKGSYIVLRPGVTITEEPAKEPERHV